MTPGFQMRKSYASLVLALALCLHGCAPSTPQPHQVQIQFLESSGLTVTNSSGQTQQLIADSRDARAVVSPSAQWIAVEDMQMSNLVVVRLFHYQDGIYEEIALPELRQHWEQLARQAGITFEDLVRPRIAIESFDPAENTLLVRFQAETEPQGGKGIDSVFAIPLEHSLK
jgi:hypothetical protein